MSMKKYLARMIRQECAALSNALLLAERPESAAFAVKVISKRLANFCADYIEEAEREMALSTGKELAK